MIHMEKVHNVTNIMIEEKRCVRLGLNKSELEQVGGETPVYQARGACLSP